MYKDTPSPGGGALEFSPKQASFTFMNPGQSLGRDFCPQELGSSWGVAQSAERRTVNADVGGSSPPAPVFSIRKGPGSAPGPFCCSDQQSGPSRRPKGWRGALRSGHPRLARSERHYGWLALLTPARSSAFQSGMTMISSLEADSVRSIRNDLPSGETSKFA